MRGFAFRLPRFVIGLVAVLICQAASAETVEERLDRLSIKFTRDDAGNIVAVELPERSVDRTIEAIADIPTITSVKAVDCRATADGFRVLGTMPALRALHLEASWRPDDHARWLAHAPGIEDLSLTRCRLSNAGLAALCKSIPKLKELDVSRTFITPHAAVHVISEGLRELEVLTLASVGRDYSVEGPVELQVLASLPELKRLRVGGFTIHSEQLYAFSFSCNLRELVISGTDLEGGLDVLMYLLRCNPSLDLGPDLGPRVARLSGRRISEDDHGIRAIRRIRHATLKAMPLMQVFHDVVLEVSQPSDLRFVESMPRLEALRVVEPRFESRAIAALEHAPRLKFFEIQRGVIDAAIVESLLSVPAIDRFSFDSCVFTEEAVLIVKREYPTGKLLVKPADAAKAMGVIGPGHRGP